jgi:hypothetical protein
MLSNEFIHYHGFHLNFKHMKKHLLLLVFLLLCTCCKTPELIKKKERTYQTGFSHRKTSGVFFNHEDSTEYVYFAAFSQPKKLLFYTVLDGESPKIEIPLDSIVNWNSITGIAIKNLDTIILFNSPSSKQLAGELIFIDRTGRCWKNIYLDEMIPADENNFKYSYWLNAIFRFIFWIMTSSF